MSPTGHDVGRLSGDAAGAVELYEAHLVATLEGRSLHGLHIVIDCANGAASAIAPEVLWARAEVIVRYDAPDGVNINEKCGSTHPNAAAAAVVAEAPTSVWRSTATPIGSSPSTRTAAS